jgi:predicted PhzF superfamily epimerase YddE/YHI9
MEIDKQQVLELLRSKGQEDKLEQAERELPDQLDTDQHVDLLSALGLEPQEVISKLGGGPLGRLTGR